MEQIISGIYKIKNIINNKVYIGKAFNLKERYNKHLYAIRHECHYNKHLQNAFYKYGEKAFIYSVLEYVNKDELSKKEKNWIQYFRSFDNTKGYNKSLGDEGVAMTEETKQKISNSLKGRQRSKKERENISNGRTGCKITNEKYLEEKRKFWREWHKIPGNSEKCYSHFMISVLQYDLSGNYLNKFKSMTEASLATDTALSSIRACVKGQYKRGGNYIWRYYDKNYSKKIKSYKDYHETKKKPVLSVDCDGKKKKYSSVANAVKNGYSKSSIIRCCKGKQKTHKGLKWFYLQESKKQLKY